MASLHDLHSKESSQIEATPATQQEPAVNTLAEFIKALSVAVPVTLLAAAGTWLYINRASLSEAATFELTPGFLMTGKTWEEHKKEGKYGSFDEALWPESADDPDREAYFRKFYESQLPDPPDIEFKFN